MQDRSRGLPLPHLEPCRGTDPVSSRPRAFAATCEQHADDVCVRAHPAVPATGYQSTVDAVSALHAAASGTGDVLATRMRAISCALSSAADQYSQTESESTDALAASIQTDSR